MIRIGIIGCGRILAAHLQAYRLLRELGFEDFRITALCSRKAADAESYIQRGEGPPQRPAVSDIPGDPLAIDAFGFALSATAIIGEWFVRPIDMPLWVIGLYGIAAAAPVAIASYFSTRPRALSFASNSATFETLLSSEVFFIMTLATVAAAMTIIQPISVSRDLWLVISLAALAMTATLLSVARLWLHGTKRRIAAAG